MLFWYKYKLYKQIVYIFMFLHADKIWLLLSLFSTIISLLITLFSYPLLAQRRSLGLELHDINVSFLQLRWLRHTFLAIESDCKLDWRAFLAHWRKLTQYLRRVFFTNHGGILWNYLKKDRQYIFCTFSFAITTLYLF